MTEKTTPKLTKVKVVTNIVCSDGYKEKGEYQSHMPGARVPAEPWQTATAVAVAMADAAARYDNKGTDLALEVIERAGSIWDWKQIHGYDRGPDPRKEVIEKLAAKLGFTISIP